MKLVDEKKILSGYRIFELLDTHGMPLEIIREELRDRGMGFNVQEFCEAAFKSGNWRPDRLYHVLTTDYGDSINPETDTLIKVCIARAYKAELPS